MKLEGWLVVIAAVSSAMLGYFTTDDAYKYVNPYLLFWLKAGCLALAIGSGSLKGWMSTSFGDQKRELAATHKTDTTKV
jgi:hypothetical protein